MMRGLSRCVLAAVCVLGMSVAMAHAEEVIAPAKKALIQELLNATNDPKMAESVANAMFLQMDRNYQRMMAEAMPAKTVAEEKSQKAVMESGLRFSKRFRELYQQRIHWNEVVAQIYFPLYDKYFTEEELKDLLAFYKSTTGKKMLTTMPQLMQESMQKVNEIISPQLAQLAKEIMQEEKERLSKLQQEGQAEPKSQPEGQGAPKSQSNAAAPPKAAR